MLNKRGLGPFTLPEVVLYIISAIAALIYTLVLIGYAGQTTPKMVITNEQELITSYMADALISLPNWDGKCGCLAKSEIVGGKEVIYPGLIPEWKLDAMSVDEIPPDFCHNHYCFQPYVIDGTKEVFVHAKISDLEDPLKRWDVGDMSEASNIGPTLNRLVAIEYPDGRVHVGSMQIEIKYD